jgi:hypothetical protein
MTDRMHARGTAVTVVPVDCYAYCPELRPVASDIITVCSVDIAAFCARLPAMTDQPGAPWTPP